jgi:hypothetical protein
MHRQSMARSSEYLVDLFGGGYGRDGIRESGCRADGSGAERNGGSLSWTKYSSA